jgi:crotonobetainyl-CoA:carnitine CoA-transferase CaiB-like acyl-CoA transferase
MNPLLAGIRILDLSRLLPGPFCTLYLAQMGAEVIKIEEPQGGDYCRSLSPELFALVNRGKQSVTLDLRRTEDVAQFHALVRTADVVLESFRPGVMDKLGCGYQTLKAINPRLVFAALTGYGQTGPYRDRPGHDMNYRGYAGELHQNAAPDGLPLTGNCQTADLAGGALTCALGVLAAVIGAKASGVGSFVDVAMLDGTLALQVAALASLRATGVVPAPGRDSLSGGVPNYGIYAAKCGGAVALGALEFKFFAQFLELAGRPELLKLPMAIGPKGAPLRQALAELIASRSRDEWEALVAHADTCVSSVLRLDEALTNAQVLARELIEQVDGKPAIALPIRFGAALPAASPAPKLGADNQRVLGALERPTVQ